jgi:hypothetical protein
MKAAVLLACASKNLEHSIKYGRRMWKIRMKDSVERPYGLTPCAEIPGPQYDSISVRVTPYSLVPNRTRSARSPVCRPGRCCEQKKGT